MGFQHRSGGAGHPDARDPWQLLPQSRRRFSRLLWIGLAVWAFGFASLPAVATADPPEVDPPEPVCEEEPIEQGTLSADTPESELRYIREQLRGICGIMQIQADHVVALLALLETQGTAATNQRGQIKGAIEALGETVSDSLTAGETTAASTEYLAEVLRGNATGDDQPVPLAVEAAPVEIASGTVEVSNPPETQDIVFATESLEEKMHANMWGLAGMATGFGLLLVLYRMVRP